MSSMSGMSGMSGGVNPRWSSSANDAFLGALLKSDTPAPEKIAAVRSSIAEDRANVSVVLAHCPAGFRELEAILNGADDELPQAKDRLYGRKWRHFRDMCPVYARHADCARHRITADEVLAWKWGAHKPTPEHMWAAQRAIDGESASRLDEEADHAFERIYSFLRRALKELRLVRASFERAKDRTGKTMSADLARRLSDLEARIAPVVAVHEPRYHSIVFADATIRRFKSASVRHRFLRARSWGSWGSSV